MKYFTKEETSSILRISIATLNRWVKDKKIHPEKIGKKVLFTEQAIEHFVTPKVSA